MNWYLKAMKSYATFKGRATRSEYWYFMLVYLVPMFVLAFMLGTLRPFDPLDPSSLKDDELRMIIFLVGAIYALIHVIPYWAVMTRRLHDINKSAWWLLVMFIPYIGQVVLMIMAMLDSKDDNKYGKNPKA